MRPAKTLYLAGAAASLPPATSVSDAVAQGHCDRRAALRSGMQAVCIGDRSGPEHAVEAARRAMKDSGVDPEAIGAVLHADVYHQGHDLWAPASYVQHHSIGGSAFSVEVRQLSNGGMAALQLATAYVDATGDRAALATTGDRFCPPGFDRWKSDVGTMYGDGGSALVLSRDDGFAVLRSVITVSDPALEHMVRAGDPFSPAPLAARSTIDISPEAHRDRAAGSPGVAQMLARLRVGQQRALSGALTEAGLRQDDVSWYVVPHLGRPRMELQMFDPLDIPVARTTWSWGSSVGHLGAGDQFAGLAHLHDSGELTPGSVCVLLGAGAGFAWSAAVLEIT